MAAAGREVVVAALAPMVAVRMIGCPVIVSGNAMSSSDAMSSAGPRRSGLPLVVVLVLFALAVGGAWGWFHL